MPATGAGRKRGLLFSMLMFLARLHSFLYMIDGGINGLNGGCAMAAFIMFGFFQVMLGLLQSFQRSLHMRLIVVIITCDSGNGNAQEAQNNREHEHLGNFSHGNLSLIFEISLGVKTKSSKLVNTRSKHAPEGQRLPESPAARSTCTCDT